MKEKPALNNKEEFPDSKVLKKVLKDKFSLFNNLIDTAEGDPHNLTHEWRFYRDGNSWLCKAFFKKKTIFWLSVWDGYFRVVFYFSAKNRDGIFDLKIDDNIKSEFRNTEFTGKLLPLIIKVHNQHDVNSIINLIEYRKKY